MPEPEQTHTSNRPSGREWSAFLPMKVPTVTHNDLRAAMRGRRPTIVKSDALRDAEHIYGSYVTHALMESPLDGPLTGPLSVWMMWCWAEDARHAAGEPRTEKPDLDNMAKTVLDILTRCGVIEDDRLVCDLRLSKSWARSDGLYVDVCEVGAQDISL